MARSTAKSKPETARSQRELAPPLATAVPNAALELPSQLTPLVILSLLAAGLAAYANSFWGEFVMDDVATFVDVDDLHDIWNWRHIFLGHKGNLPVRPLPYFTFALNYAFDGLNPRYYHAVNLSIHITNALLIFGIIRRTLLQPRFEDQFGQSAIYVAWAAALLWMVHPIQTMAVTYVYQRMESLMAMFYLLTVWTFIRSHSAQDSNRWLVLSVVACASGMACKEVMVTVPVFMLWYDRVFITQSWTEIWQKRKTFYMAIFATYVILALAILSQQMKYGEFTKPRHSGLVYALNQPRSILMYLRIIVWPVSQCIFYDYPAEYRIEAILPSLLFLLTIVGLVVREFPKRPALAFGLGSFFLILSVSSSFVAVQSLEMEHRMYLPSVALFAVSCTVVTVGVQQIKHASWQKIMGGLAACTVVLLGCIWAYATFLRNQEYYSTERMWQNVVNVSPLGLTGRRAWLDGMESRGKVAEALLEAQQLVAKYPQSYEAHVVLSEALQLQKKWEESFAPAKEALRLNPHSDEAHYIIASGLSVLNRSKEAISEYQLAISENPIFMRAYLGLGRELALLEKYPEAIHCLRKAVQVSRYATDALQDLALLLDETGQTEEAAKLFEEFLSVNPKHALARSNFAGTLLKLNRPAEAVEQLQKVVAAEPEVPAHRLQLAQALAACQRPAEALVELRQGAKLAPLDAEIQANLGRALWLAGEHAAAVAQLELALKIQPNWPEVTLALAQWRLTKEAAETYNPAEAVRLLQTAWQQSDEAEPSLLQALAAAQQAAGDEAGAKISAEKLQAWREQRKK